MEIDVTLPGLNLYSHQIMNIVRYLILAKAAISVMFFVAQATTLILYHISIHIFIKKGYYFSSYNWNADSNNEALPDILKWWIILLSVC